MALGVAGLAASGSAAFGAQPQGARLARMARSPQWKDGRFENPQPLQNDMWRALLDWFSASEDRRPSGSVPTAPLDAVRFDRPPPTGLRVTWLGHSTLILEVDGLRVLVDPVWGERAFPFSWLGPRRFYAPLLPLGQLPHMDAVVISHDHYDHLDMPTIQAMKDWKTTFIVPLGAGAHLEAWGVPEERIVELDWWERTRLGDVEIVATPARHASGRSPFSQQNRTLWAGFAFIGPIHRAYYSGDTGFFPGLDDIGARLGPFDLAMIEAGAYGRSWPDWHLGPEQAVRASRMVRADLLLPVHWGLFNLAYHGWTEPAERVLVAAGKAGVRVAIPMPGQSIEPGALPRPTRWWPVVPWKTAEEDPIVASRMGAATVGVGDATPEGPYVMASRGRAARVQRGDRRPDPGAARPALHLGPRQDRSRAQARARPVAANRRLPNSVSGLLEDALVLSAGAALAASARRSAARRRQAPREATAPPSR